jgi:hypothetical protein
MKDYKLPEGFNELMQVSFMEALLGRRSRRFFMGAEIPDGVFKYKSRHPPMPLSELEKLLVVMACGGNTSWHNMIYRAQAYAPYLSNYAASAGGRTFPSAAGFHTSKIFFTNDDGVYLLDARDVPPFGEKAADGTFDVTAVLGALKARIRKLQDGRLKLLQEPPYIEAHNTWVVNQPSTLVVIPVGDLAQHVLLGLCYMLQNNTVLTDDINRKTIPGIEKFKNIVDVDNVWPLSFVEKLSLAELSVELSTSCYAGALMLQAMGLGGWMFDGLDPFSVLGASGNPLSPGLGFRYDTHDNWATPNPTGLEGVLEGHCPPHYPDMRAAVDAVCERKFGPGGPFHPTTPGHWKDSRKVRSAAKVHDEAFKDCISLQAQYILDTFGKFPGTVPSIFVLTYLQAHHLDLEFYDQFYEPGAYLKTHAAHMEKWHP